MKNIFKKKSTRIIGGVILTIIIMYMMIYVDVTLRARHAYLQGEKYWGWHEHPQQKKLELGQEFNKEKLKLDKKLAKNKITEEEYNRQLDIAKFNHERKIEESSIKYAYVWYQTTVELFSPPRSKWVRLARKKMPLAKEKWKEELKNKNIPFEEYMLE
jgi:hypothetical protein